MSNEESHAPESGAPESHAPESGAPESGAPATGSAGRSALSYGRGHTDPAEYEAMDRLAKMFEHQVDLLQGKTDPASE